MLILIQSQHRPCLMHQNVQTFESSDHVLSACSSVNAAIELRERLDATLLLYCQQFNERQLDRYDNTENNESFPMPAQIFWTPFSPRHQREWLMAIYLDEKAPPFKDSREAGLASTVWTGAVSHICRYISHAISTHREARETFNTEYENHATQYNTPRGWRSSENTGANTTRPRGKDSALTTVVRTRRRREPCLPRRNKQRPTINRKPLFPHQK